MNKYFRGILVALMMTFSFSIVSAQQAAVLEFFHGAECPHCHEEKKFLPVVQKMYPDLEIREYEVWHDEENKAFADKRLAEFGTRLEGVPTNIIGEEVIVGFQKEKILKSLEKNYGKSSISSEEAEKMISNNTNPAKKWAFLTILLVIIGGTTYSFMDKKDKK